MIYSNILKPKFRNLLRAFVLLLLAIFSLSLYSCQTTWVENYSPDKLRADDDVKILNVTTKNDSTIYLADYNAKYYQHFRESMDVLLWEKTDTIYIKSEPKKEYKLQNKISTINLRDILYARVEKQKTNVPLTILLVTGIIATVLVVLVIALSPWKIGPLFGDFHYKTPSW
ncbi:MAG TPA: hypothetical protein VIL99_16340 [Ignavibacteria bacterium]